MVAFDARELDPGAVVARAPARRMRTPLNARRSATMVCLALCSGIPAACGSSGSSPSTSSLVAIAPTNVPALVPTVVEVSGGVFGAWVGWEVAVHLTADSVVGDPYVFADGSAREIGVTGVVTSATVIEFETPKATLCGQPSHVVYARVRLPDGTQLTGGSFVYDAAMAVSLAPATVSAASPTPFTITGTGFAPVGSPASVRFQARSGTPFDGLAFHWVTATVTSSTAIVGLAPTVPAGPDFAADVVAYLEDGTCVATDPLGVAITFTTGALPPLLVTDVPGDDLTVSAGELSEFTISATSTVAGNLDLRLVNPLPGMSVAPLLNAASPAALAVRWFVPDGFAGQATLTFVANETGQPSTRVERRVRVRCPSNYTRSVVVADVTGDGVPDAIGGGRSVRIGGLPTVGAVYVWAGASTPSGVPTATCLVPGAVASDSLTSSNDRFEVGDVTGDGVLDIVAGSREILLGGIPHPGAAHVFAGGPGLSGTVAPASSLFLPFLVTTQSLITRTSLVLAEVTGDAVLDVVLTSSGSTYLGVANAGAVCVWHGGAGLTGSPPPTATLGIPGSTPADGLGQITSGPTTQAVDVTGDGVRDLVVGAHSTDVGGIANAGAIYVWAGGATLTGAPGPLARLQHRTAPSAGDALGSTTSPNGGAESQGIQIADVTGDGVPDVIGCAPGADEGGITDSGGVYVWKGGASLTGVPLLPTASLVSPTPTALDRLGVSSGVGVQAVDVSGDGVLDVVVASALTDAGAADAGSVLVWAGGAALAGTPAPLATLTVTGAVAGDQLGLTSAQGLFLADVSGDDIPDVVVGAQGADAGGLDTGAMYVWNGGPGLVGALGPTATLTVSTGAPGDMLGFAWGHWIQAVDLTGDGALDLLAAAQNAGGTAGAAYVFAGGSGLSGSVGPLASLAAPGAVAGDSVGQGLLNALGRDALVHGDVTGDGIADILLAAPLVTAGGVSDAGVVCVWAGGASLTGTPSPLAVLSAPAAASDSLSRVTGWQGLQAADVTGDGIWDVVVGSSLYGSADTGAIFAWAGGAGLSGTPAPVATLAVPGAAGFDRLGTLMGLGFYLLDMTGDGQPDILSGSFVADVGGLSDTGALYLWKGGGTLSGPVAPTTSMTVPGASSGDQIGN